MQIVLRVVLAVICGWGSSRQLAVRWRPASATEIGASYCECLSATGFDNSAASRTEPPTVRLEAIRNCIVPLILHPSAKLLHIGSTSTLLFRSAQVALCAASLGKSNRR
jgi:hypothetical protein